MGFTGVRSDCRLTRFIVENTNRIFTYRDDSGSYQLLRTELVPSGMKLSMFCDVNNVLETQCQDNGEFTVALPMTCGSPMEPHVTKSKDAACPKTLYIVGYVIEGQQLELYRSCYDENNGRVLYSQSDVYFKTFFFRPPFVQFTTDEIVTPAEAAAYFKHNIYSAFQRTFGDAQEYLSSPNDLVINRGHLVASADFLFVDQMSSTYRYLNIVPQFKSINDQNWEKVERWLRSQVPANSPFRIKTGGIKVLKLQDVKGDYYDIYLSESKLPVPKWIYKVVRDHNGNGIYVFLSFNSTFERSRPQAPDLCQPIPCPFHLSDNANEGFIYCCDPKRFPY
ncbi:GH20125 [Drosophila grimshawi]|uniref:GH20125 n=1 Tax=Drosophila grimshawi TaxID=7222 RepID=B4J6V0_DROGR|nr:GH20125 [Drosophila grimshawi]